MKHRCTAEGAARGKRPGGVTGRDGLQSRPRAGASLARDFR